MFRLKAVILSIFFPVTPCFSHEAWVLSPSEFAALAAAPVPAIFLSSTTLLTASVVALTLVTIALWAQERFAPIELRMSEGLASIGILVGGPILRIGLAIPIGLGALGGLPRHGTDIWTQATFFVPDMQLGSTQGADIIVLVCVFVATLLIFGLWTRIAACCVILLTFLGGQLFGATFLYSYAAHFAAPAMLLIWLGPGALSLDRHYDPDDNGLWHKLSNVWPVMLLMTGATFVYLSLAMKLAHPTLLIAILEHAGLDRFGVPLAWVALLMMGVELIAGLLLMMGHLVRPIGLFLIFAFTLFSIMLNETPLFHANLYALTAMLVLFGAKPCSEHLRSPQWRVFRRSPPQHSSG